jgi:hypothetical protein
MSETGTRRVARWVRAGLVGVVMIAAVPRPYHASAQGGTGELIVTARDGADRLLAGVEVSLDGPDWFSGQTDGAGGIRWRVAAGQWDVVVTHDELAMIPTRASVAIRAGETRSMSVRGLPRSGEIRGRVTVTAPPTILTTLHVAVYPVDANAGDLPIAVAPVAEDLTFALAVPPGRWRVGPLEIPVSTKHREVAVEAGQPADVGLDADFGSLTGAAGFAYEAGLVTERIGPRFSLTSVGLYVIEGTTRPRITAMTQVRTDQSYAVFMASQDGAAPHAFAWRPGWSAVPAAYRLSARTGDAAYADFRFVPNSGALAGTVTDEQGRPVPDAWVAVVSAVRFEDWMMWNRPVRALNGGFSLRVPLGPVLVRAWRDPRRPGEPTRVQVPASSPATLRLRVP